MSIISAITLSRFHFLDVTIIGGSFYLQSKIFRAREALGDEFEPKEEPPSDPPKDDSDKGNRGDSKTDKPDSKTTN